MAAKNCADIPENFAHAKSSLQFKFTQQQILAATNSAIWADHRDALAKQWRLLLTAIEGQTSQRQFSKRQFVELIRATQIEHQGNIINGDTLYRQSSNAEWYRIQDYLEVAQLQPDGQRRHEVVSLDHNKNHHSRDIYQRFVAMAAQVSRATSPTILVVTASARDPFEPVDFYRNAFISAGADSVHWLPLDAAVQQLRRVNDDHRCEQLAAYHQRIQGVHNRQAVYPDLVSLQQRHCQQPELTLALIEQADGIFVNGGDQSLTVQAFRHSDGSDSAELALIKQKLAAGTLVVGGTSAGTAVQAGNQSHSVAMITNGSSLNALRYGAFSALATAENCHKDGSCGELPDNALSYKKDGGLGLFQWGISDTHFAERGRHTRLAILAKQTGSRLGFGIDEATALLANSRNAKGAMTVIGQGGVHLLDVAQATLTKSQAGISLSNVRWHGLFAGDHFNITEDGSVRLSHVNQQPIGSGLQPTSKVAVTLPDQSDVFYDASLRKQGQQLALRVAAGKPASDEAIQSAKEFALTLSADQQTQVFCQPQAQPTQCSWLDMAISVSPNSD
ncbi:cyanophycinase [Neiella sp. HB171785]|uniref:Cyanophycinase n=1 Tax=Neiella litorisoli TaxID=2771431 RepID=A0A8J6QFL2_9GAMM|nr:cyanophycinase [Neiella litorisoli]MBD1388490.1 cyanophycinase [Neiella litorisoli]